MKRGGRTSLTPGSFSCQVAASRLHVGLQSVGQAIFENFGHERGRLRGWSPLEGLCKTKKVCNARQ